MEHGSDFELERPRTYRKTTRAASEQATGDAILEAALRAFSSEPFDRVTLQQIAERSGVTVQTVIRRFGSKEGLFETLVERESRRVVASREAGPDADLPAALKALLDHYEHDGDAVLNFVAQERLFDPVRAVVERGRRVHREWVERHCGGILAGTRGRTRRRRLHAAILITDLSSWKLLRRDLGLDQREVAAVMTELLHALERRD
jgi:AcrR family transcriptional regulator